MPEVTQDPTPRTKNLLYGLSCRCCAKCTQQLILEDSEGVPYPRARVSHIETTHEGPRYNPSLMPEEARLILNLVLLCPNCHAEVDDDVNGFPVNKMQRIKHIHDERCKDIISKDLADMTYIPIKIIAMKLAESKSEVSEQDLTLIPPAEKIKKNGLVKAIDFLNMGYMGVRKIKDYLSSEPVPEEVQRITNGFVTTYSILFSDNYRGDELFFALHEHITGYSYEKEVAAAGYAMIAYFFDICEAFEK